LTERRIRNYLSVAIGLAMLVAACNTPSGGGTPIAAEQIDPNGHLITNTGTEPSTIDPNKASFSDEIEQIMSVFEGLMTLDPKTLKPLPAAAAKDPEISADGLTWKVTLRDGLKYSDGSPLTAKDFAYGFARSCDPAVSIDYAFVLFVVVGCEDYNNMDAKKSSPAELKAARDKLGIKTNGDKEIVFTLTEPAAYFASILYMWVGMPARESDVVKGGERWTEPATYIGNGPFILKEWRHNDRFEYEANPNYRLGKPKLAKWTRTMIAENSVSFAAYRSDQLDEMGVRGENMRAIEADPDLKKQVIDRVAAFTSYYGFNVTRPPFNDPNVRLAFAKAFDREAYVRDVIIIGKPATGGFIPPGIPGYDEGDTAQKFDVAAARQLLDKASPEARAALTSIKYTFSSTAVGKTRAEWIQQQWEKNLPGVKIALDPVDASALSGLFKGGASGASPQAFGLTWIADFPDQQNWFTTVFISKSGIHSRRTGYSNAKYDELVRAADKEKDPKKRDEMYLTAGRMLSQDAPTGWLAYGASRLLRKPWVKGVSDSSIDSATGQFKQYEIYITKH
jgi:oligopeptide transport system substrate-binding protein